MGGVSRSTVKPYPQLAISDYNSGNYDQALSQFETYCLTEKIKLTMLQCIIWQ